MAQEQANLASNFSSFINDFIAKDVDFRMAIITTDTSSTTKCGKIVTGSDTKLTSAKADQNQSQFLADFASLVQVGVSGSGSEQGLKASECFIDKSAASLLRSDAYLVAVYMSDEQDQSSKTPAEYLAKLQSVKANPGLVKAFSIVNIQGLTFGDTLTLGYDRYDYVSSHSGGSTHDIFSNFSNSLSAMGDQIIDLLDSFPLAHAPMANIVVKVNNVAKVKDVDYEVNASAIKFLPGKVPAAGAAVSVSYDY
jgi:hypothetical protein